MWDISEYEWACSSESIMYECYYFDKYKQLIFISPSHESICMFCIDINELLNTFKSKQKAGCKVKKYKYIRDLVRSYNIRRLIIKSITNHHKKEPKEQSVQIIGYHVNRVDSEIYIVAKYILNEGRNITKDAVKIYKGLFIGRIINKTISFDLHFYTSYVPSANYKILPLSNKRDYNLLKLELFYPNYLHTNTLRYSRVKDLDWLYNNNTFFSLSYNRCSPEIIKGEYIITSTDMLTIDSLLLIRYKYSGNKDAKTKIKEFMIIVRDLLLVGKMAEMKFDN
jgi:hypothetical protein